VGLGGSTTPAHHRRAITVTVGFSPRAGVSGDGTRHAASQSRDAAAATTLHSPWGNGGLRGAWKGDSELRSPALARHAAATPGRAATTGLRTAATPAGVGGGFEVDDDASHRRRSSLVGYAAALMARQT
jgi:hypothetical protein